jgi:tetratricopeptide (TPR) repeat protein
MTRSLLLRNVLGIALGAAVCALPSLAQRTGGQTPAPTTPPTTGGGSIPGGGGRTPTPTPSPTPTPGRQGPDIGPSERPGAIFLSGKVVMDDGSAPPESVTIERVCNGRPYPEGYTDSKGRFSFQLGQSMNVMPDASVNSTDSGRFSDNPPVGGNLSRSTRLGGGGISERELISCEIRASLVGFRSDSVNLAGRRMMDNPDVGTIVLHRMANVAGTTISATTMQAPKDAKKAYEKGREALKKKNAAEAQKQLEKAVAAYPKYAAAWYYLGVAQIAQNNGAEARKSFEQSISSDDKFVPPYVEMARVAAKEQKWQEVADQTEKVTKLDPFDFPDAFYLSALANLQLRKLDTAENSARQAIKLDTTGRFREMDRVLGVILANKADYAGAKQYLGSYLQKYPDSPNADSVRKILADIQAITGGGAASVQNPQPKP